VARTRALSSALSVAVPCALLAGVAGGCRGRNAPPAADDGANAPSARPASAESQNPLDLFIDQAGTYLVNTQNEDGSWPYFHSPTPDFANPEPHPILGTPMTLLNLTHTGFEASSAFKRGSDYLRGRMIEGFVWSVYETNQFGDAAWAEPDVDNTAVCLTVLAGRLSIDPAALKKVRALLDQNRAPDGLYRTYFDGFYRQKGFVPDRNVPSLGVNLDVLGFLGRYEQPRTGLVEAIKSAMKQDRYWEKTPYYHSLPVLAYLASNAVEHGAPEAGDLQRKLLADFEAIAGAPPGFAENLPTLELAAYVKARAHSCLLDHRACSELDMTVFHLARRRNADGSWNATPFYEYDTNPQALEAFVARRDYKIPRKRGGVAFDVERALAAPGTVHYYDGSPAETTSFALKALVFYRELLSRRGAFTSGRPAASAAPQR
jgi:Prenyltransferase and squalene oxidase repeat